MIVNCLFASEEIERLLHLVVASFYGHTDWHLVALSGP